MLQVSMGDDSSHSFPSGDLNITMIQLTGINLGQRHYEINKKVDELFTQKESFEKLNAIEEKSDVDRLIKIDLANLHKNVEYLANTLKCGDPLYISRALKCTSLFEDYDIINPEYLHSNIIPFMSQKMKRKMLTAIAMHVKDQERVDSFYRYCLNHKLNAIANKFLINASQLCKEEYLKSHTVYDKLIKFKFFFGNCYDLIDKHIERKKLNNCYYRSDPFSFSYLFSSSAEKYLNFLEECLEKEKCTYYNSYNKFGLRMSKIIMTKHKQRVFDKPWLYLGFLDESMITRYTSSDDAKKFALAFLPDKCEDFWSTNFYEKYAFFLKKIPDDEIYAFLKHIFASKYSNEIFEMNFSFYRLKYHKFMTKEEIHEWALKHIEQKKEHFGPLRDYKWYKFVKFNKAFFEIKKLISVNNSANVRSYLIRVLVKSASQEDVEVLLKYYYKRHINESTFDKERFVNYISYYHNVYKFNEKCWAIFSKLLHSLGAFIPKNKSPYSILAVLYNVVNYKTIPNNLEKFCAFGEIHHGLYYYRWNVIYSGRLDLEQEEFAFNYLKEYFVKKIKQMMDTDSENLKKIQVKTEIVLMIWSIICLYYIFRKLISDFPEIVMKGVKLYWDEFCYEGWFESDSTKSLVTEGYLLRLLKKDKKLLLEKFPTDKEYYIRCTNVLERIKIYFNDDVANVMKGFYQKKLLQLYAEKDSYPSFDQIIFNLIQLSNVNFKTKLMSEYAPASPKIVHDEIDRNLLKIQKAICNFMHTSRPPVPLSSIQMYLRGDYVPFCLPVFNSYVAHLPLSASLEFIESLLDSPVSIQKHGIRLAFDSYETDNLVEIITKIWDKTQNVLLRLVIFKTLINKIQQVSDSDQIKLYEALKMFISSLRVDDSEDIYKLLSSTRLNEKLFSDFLEEAWNAVNRLPLDSRAYIERRCEVIGCLETHIGEIDRNICKNIINDHISTMFAEKHILEHDDTYNISTLYSKKWNLTAKYVSHFNDDQELQSSMEILHEIIRKCFDIWNETKEITDLKQQEFIVRKFLHNFLYSIKRNVQYKHNSEQKPLMNTIFQSIVKLFEECSTMNYAVIIDFKIAILIRNIIGDGKYNKDEDIICYKHLDCESVAKQMSQGVIDLLAEQYYPSLPKIIADRVTINLREITNATDLDCGLLIMMVSRYLSEQPKHDLRLLALQMISLDKYKEYADEFNTITKNIISSNDDDLNSFLYHNFVWSDFVNRIPELLM